MLGRCCVAVVLIAGCSGTTSPLGDGGAGGGGAQATGGGAASVGGGVAGVTGGGSATGCLAGDLLASLGKSRLLVGAQMEDATAGAAAFDVRYLYLSGAPSNGTGPCSSCTASCATGASSCVNGGCNWWGCWQYDQLPPGAYVRDFVSGAKAKHQLPMITYYELLGTSGYAEGQAEIINLQDVALMQRYFADFRFMLQQLGDEPALLHLEPDFWGYAQFGNSNPHAISAAVATANPTDCGSQENSFAGFGRCLVSMVRTYASHTKVGLHASAWSTRQDVSQNTMASFDVVGEANKTAAFLRKCGAAEADFIVVEASDRDAGFYRSMGQSKFWDDTNATLPNFHQAFTWVKAVSDALGRPAMWWQLPIGNMALNDTNKHWKDNRLDYFFAHPGEVAAANGAGFFFGAGEAAQTTPESDNGHLINQVKAYVAAGGQAPCP